MNNQRIAEWLSDEPSFGEDPEESAESADPRGRHEVVPEAFADAEGDTFPGFVESPQSPQPVESFPSAAETSAKSVERPGLRTARWRQLPTSLGLEGPEARILEMVEAMGRRIRRRPLTALAAGFAAGFLIGGALSFRAGRILLAAGARRVGRELLKQLL